MKYEDTIWMWEAISRWAVSRWDLCGWFASLELSVHDHVVTWDMRSLAFAEWRDENSCMLFHNAWISELVENEVPAVLLPPYYCSVVLPSFPSFCVCTPNHLQGPFNCVSPPFLSSSLRSLCSYLCHHMTSNYIQYWQRGAGNKVINITWSHVL